MPEADTKVTKDFRFDKPQASEGFHVKGAGSYDWGMKYRLGRIFQDDGRTVMLAIDHGYFQGPTSGLERIDLDIVPLLPQADALMCTRGILRSTIPPGAGNPVVLRASGGPSILKELSDEEIAVAMDDALRLDVSAVAVQVFIGGEHETRSVHNMTRLIDEGMRVGMPVMAVTAVGRELVRDAKYLGLATRMLAELGAQIVKTSSCEPDFEHVTAACPVPIVMAGGTKVSEPQALQMAYDAIQGGASGVDMGRNVFQSHYPQAMLAAINGVVHDGLAPEDAYVLFQKRAKDD